KVYKQDLIDFQENIYTMMINLATKGKWKEWDKKMKEGSEFTFSLDMLLNVGDKNIDKLFELYSKVNETVEGIK
ncbi:MAG TPA: hypothetical protein PK563_13850, partial [Tenuifilaceae bacterium]|nr:hypothetical protein [Tenuifilaceae bacterium]